MKIRKIDLAIQAGCVSCGKDCNWRAGSVAKDSTTATSAKYGCNTSK